MNIFALHHNPALAARDHCDKHVVKMIVEYAQLLSTAHRILDGQQIKRKNKIIYLLAGENLVATDDKPGDKMVIQNAKCYAATHINHPCGVWVRHSIENYNWLVDLLKALLDEYTSRYGRIHATNAYLNFFEIPPKNIPIRKGTEFAQCMPEQYHVKNDPISAYKAFYLGEKLRFAKWRYSATPTWVLESIVSSSRKKD